MAATVNHPDTPVAQRAMAFLYTVETVLSRYRDQRFQSRDEQVQREI